MATISKANRRRKAPGLTRNGRPSYKSFSLKKLEELLQKTSVPKIRHKINNHIISRKARDKKSS